MEAKDCGCSVTVSSGMTILHSGHCRYPALLAENAELKRQLTMAQANNHERNIELDALHYVWCDGGCKGGVHRFGEHPPLTAEIVAAAERNARRLRSWYVNHEGHEAPPVYEERIPAWQAAERAVFRADIEKLEQERDALAGFKALAENIVANINGDLGKLRHDQLLHKLWTIEAMLQSALGKIKETR